MKRTRTAVWHRTRFVMSLFLVLALANLPAAGPAAAQQRPTDPSTTSVSAPPDVPPPSVEELTRECQQQVTGKDRVGFIWWIPFEFWEASARQGGGSVEDARKQFKSLQEYVTVSVVVAKMGGLGSMEFIPRDTVRANLTVRDALGKEWKPLDNISEEARMLTQVLKPMFASSMGKMGENIELYFFPARNAAGGLIADPLSRKTFSVVLRNVYGPEELNFTWQLPLNALAPPAYCPTGKERVQANWKFCPWHGTRLALSGKPD